MDIYLGSTVLLTLHRVVRSGYRSLPGLAFRLPPFRMDSLANVRVPRSTRARLLIRLPRLYARLPFVTVDSSLPRPVTALLPLRYGCWRLTFPTVLRITPAHAAPYHRTAVYGHCAPHPTLDTAFGYFHIHRLPFTPTPLCTAILPAHYTCRLRYLD